MQALDAYLSELRMIHGAGVGVREMSYYPALSTLLAEVGATLKPKVHPVIHIQNTGAGIPDGGLFSHDQLRHEAARDPSFAVIPSRGAIEVKGTGEDVLAVARSQQVAGYLERYGQVLVTNLRDFQLVGRDRHGNLELLERYSLADSEASFWQAASRPGALAAAHGERFTEYLKRVMLSRVALREPRDVAWFLASYARDARARVEAANLTALANVRAALEQALGLRFESERGDHFFRSTLVQTLFYGVFSAWVLWHRERLRGPEERFDWRIADWSLHVPIIRALYHQLTSRDHLEPLGLVEVLDWTAAALNRVDRAAFFERFEEAHAVQYFYEPFLQEFDPELRRQLGVWYTPPEIVTYMVERVDTVLREELGVLDGLASPEVYVLDPATGTGSYLVEVLKRIDRTLREQGADALTAQRVKQAATRRVFGFEILPAPFVVAHLQLGLYLQGIGAPLRQDERAGVYLTNALTGWEAPDGPRQRLMFHELEEERDAAAVVKQETPILVVIGNPPYSGFAGVAVAEERLLTEAYKHSTATRQPQGQGLNDLYVRFFRMAERKIVEMGGQGVVCYISNYSWLDGLSFPAMRERYLDVFDRIWIDNLNGDKYKTGKTTPDGKPDPSVFSTEWSREGIQVGTAVTLLARTPNGTPERSLRYRELWGVSKRTDLLAALEAPQRAPYTVITPPAELGLPFTPVRADSNYLSWPLLPELFPTSFPGVKTSRDDVVVDIDRDRLVRRMEQYFDPSISHEQMRGISPEAMANTTQFQAETTREILLRRGFLPDNVVRYSYRPFDVRWLYWEPETKLLDRPRAEYFPHVFDRNKWVVTQQKPRREWSPPQSISAIGCLDLMDRGATCFPQFLSVPSQLDLFSVGSEMAGTVENVSDAARMHLTKIGAEDCFESLFHHTFSILHARVYRDENAGALRQDWPRIPLPQTRELLEHSAALGRQVAALLDTEKPVEGVTRGSIRPELRPIASLTHVHDRPADPGAGDFILNASWGYRSGTGAVMPGGGRATPRDYTPDERAAIEAGASALGLDLAEAFARLGETTVDVWLNERVYWRNVPSSVWSYTIGGYQVIKKWLSYREHGVLGRALRMEEVEHVTATARRIAAILLLEAELDESYRAVSAGGDRE